MASNNGGKWNGEWPKISKLEPKKTKSHALWYTDSEFSRGLRRIIIKSCPIVLRKNVVLCVVPGTDIQSNPSCHDRLRHDHPMLSLVEWSNCREWDYQLRQSLWSCRRLVQCWCWFWSCPSFFFHNGREQNQLLRFYLVLYQVYLVPGTWYLERIKIKDQMRKQKTTPLAAVVKFMGIAAGVSGSLRNALKQIVLYYR